MMRAKMRVGSVIRSSPTFETITCMAVTAKPFGPAGESEDNTFARYTPSANLTMSITNPDLVGKINEGDTFYVDFTKVES